MADATQYMFKHADLVTALIKAQGIRTGRWQLTLTFGFAASNVGPSESEFSPAAIIPIQAVGIQLVDNTVPSNNLIVDAAVVNPAP
jgi:hypothetical protein